MPYLRASQINASKCMSNTLFTGKVYLRFDELPSTNDFARELLAKSRPPEGTVIRADTQTAGRGQFGSQWLSAPGENLTLSIILYPNWLRVADQFRLSETSALAVYDTVHRLLPSTVQRLPSIKWPNDIYMGSRKVAGILIQNTLAGACLETSVVGIGLNVNQTDFSSGAPNAASLALASGTNFDLEQVSEVLMECLERRYLQLKSGHSEALRSEYQARLYGLGEEKKFARPDGSVFTGTIQGVEPDGRLAVHIAGGALERFEVKSIQLLAETI